MQKALVAQLVWKCQELITPSFTAKDLLTLFVEHGLSESARSVKGSILSDCHQTKISILKYLTAIKPQANQERRTLELRCLEID